MKTTAHKDTMIIELDEDDDVRLVFGYLVDFVRNVRGMFRIKNFIINVSNLDSNNKRIVYQLYNEMIYDDWVERLSLIHI